MCASVPWSPQENLFLPPPGSSAGISFCNKGKIVVEDFILSAQVVDGALRVNTLRVHDRAACTGRGFACVIHAPSDHHMKSWPLGWRMDTGVMERMCPHGVGHPDPDHIGWVVHCDPTMTWHGTHGCDGCCNKSMWKDTAW